MPQNDRTLSERQPTSNPLDMSFEERAYWLEANLGGPVIRHQIKDSLIADYNKLKALTPETTAGEVAQLRETVQRYVEHHEHCDITKYHGVREKSALSHAFDLAGELRRYFDSGTLNEASDLYPLLREIEAMKTPAAKAGAKKGQMTEVVRAAEERPITPDLITFHVDGRQFTTGRANMPTCEILNTAGVPHTWRLSQENDSGPDTYLRDTEMVSVSGKRFHTEPQGITRG